MDIYLGNNGNRFSNYFLSMANLEVQNLLSTVYAVSAFNIKDGLTRVRFHNDVKNFAMAQLDAIRIASSESHCRECLNNLRQETNSLKAQDRMLRTGEATLHASVAFLKRGDVQGYIINGIGVVLGGLQVVAGLGVIAVSVASGNPVGVIFGGMLTLHGANSVQEAGENLIYKTNDSTGLLKQGYVKTAEFLGFDARVGNIAYSSADLALSAYGMIKLTLKPEAWRLFHYVNADYVRGIQKMSRIELGIEIYNDVQAIKSINDNYNK
ncbi:DUF4225 domain-containing protein [Brenneria tiliae]|uniref:DUF4225 domain-containing protein n=1 Tax=Brenneria tiliae TaxID=2914984 RepID=UPI002014BEB5|nr:DUF4225 domain-containing protein [Brenneria tiliae]MCL2898721.1 DUF4225 domain-containing protein [Brenneria tiliae]MCL2903342.1 DUF4225 domain-containing protein [Brenneria tiliae]